METEPYVNMAARAFSVEPEQALLAMSLGHRHASSSASKSAAASASAMQAAYSASSEFAAAALSICA